MLIRYKFATGETTEVEVNDEIGEFIIDSRRGEDSADRKERRHCYSMDAALYQGLDYATEPLFDEEDDTLQRALSKLTEVQRKRILLYSQGLSIREIARREDKDYSSVKESIRAAQKKLKKFL